MTCARRAHKHTGETDKTHASRLEDEGISQFHQRRRLEICCPHSMVAPAWTPQHGQGISPVQLLMVELPREPNSTGQQKPYTFSVPTCKRTVFIETMVFVIRTSNWELKSVGAARPPLLWSHRWCPTARAALHRSFHFMFSYLSFCHHYWWYPWVCSCQGITFV